MKTFSIGGVHPHDKKISAGCRIETLPTPKTVYISMSQHLGAPANCIVAGLMSIRRYPVPSSQ